VSQSVGVGGTLPTSIRSAPFWAAVAAALAAAVYAIALNGPFVYDDLREVLQNPSIGDLTDLPSILRHYPTRPVTNLSYAIDFAIGGLDPFQYHLTNLLLHVANVVLLFGLILQLVREAPRSESAVQGTDTFAAFAAAAVFAVHPMMSGAVSYISARAEVLAATLFLASFHCLRRAVVGSSPKFLVCGIALALLAIGAKETAVVMPAVVLAYDLLVARPVGRPWRKRVWLFYGPVFGAMLLLAAVRTWWYLSMEISEGAGFHWKHLLLELHVIHLYLSMMFLPLSQSIVPPVAPIAGLLDPRLVTAIGGLGVATAVAVAAHKRESLITFGLAWFGLALLPSALLFIIGERGSAMAEHRVYLASGGFFIAAGAAISRVVPRLRGARPRWAYAGLAALLGVSMTATTARNRIWADPVLLWQDAVEKGPGVWMAHLQLGYTYQQIEDHAAASAAFREAIALLPDDPTAYLELARSLGELGQIQEARSVLRTAVQRIPGEVRTMIALAHIEGGPFNNPAAAAGLCREALAINRHDPGALSCAARYDRPLANRNR
jgi:drug/metabolite transporter superfamily protein YnfA